MVIVEIDSHVDGHPPLEPCLNSVVVHLQGNRVTVAELIKRAVEAQVRELAICRRLSPAVIRRVLDLYYAETPTGLRGLNDRINTRSEVKSALKAFAGEIFRVLIDDQPIAPELERQLYLRSESRVRFVREQIA